MVGYHKLKSWHNSIMCDTTMIRLLLLYLKDTKIKLGTLDLEKNIILASKGEIPKATPVDETT